MQLVKITRSMLISHATCQNQKQRVKVTTRECAIAAIQNKIQIFWVILR
jgi:hypothetical protein